MPQQPRAIISARRITKRRQARPEKRATKGLRRGPD
ncbi:hypothetical protein BIW11_02024 [Tropilaelaps mercedesae]|uniref:Uncharacterized protein n=1 Tax=Tropilaelaps mercedesae TaxID=418985 RepID=A0A1V9X431_9ACAR|nr:hypothetical protein BIW11_02024 [Tropilaelaps mercedesae]